MKKKQTLLELNKVTTFSKLLAMILFIALPFVGFKLGMSFQKVNNSQVNETQSIKTVPTTQLTTTPTSNTLKVKLLSTENWQNVDSGIFTLKIPKEFSYYVFNSSEIGLYNNSKPEGSQTFSIKRRGQTKFGDRYEYTGGSMRDWWLKENKGDSDHPTPNFIFTDKKYGTVSGLEVSWGGEKRDILVSYGSRIYDFSDGSDGKKWSILETIVSSFKEK